MTTPPTIEELQARLDTIVGMHAPVFLANKHRYNEFQIDPYCSVCFHSHFPCQTVLAATSAEEAIQDLTKYRELIRSVNALVNNLKRRRLQMRPFEALTLSDIPKVVDFMEGQLEAYGPNVGERMRQMAKQDAAAEETTTA